ncbi:hypothetical protein PsYK624_048770 [Phanerochaete sordida]|uniref:Uncharacterized protein n=1 Tax=Phanerochaete sordida TaxID=48140 RepID=A0A9P3G6M8_9APHY|nr:hypothetical protein PsYK624_048770 [Phanerochaete sordida]
MRGHVEGMRTQTRVRCDTVEAKGTAVRSRRRAARSALDAVMPRRYSEVSWRCAMLVGGHIRTARRDQQSPSHNYSS